MADHFISINGVGEVFSYATNTLTVATSSTTGSPLELRVTDDAVTAEQIYEFCERLADYASTRNPSVFLPGTLAG